MKTVLIIKNKFQDNHWSFKSTAASQVLRASKLQVFYHAWRWFLSGVYRYSPGQSLVRCFHIDMVRTTVVPRTELHIKHESSNKYWFFWEACLATDARLSEKSVCLSRCPDSGANGHVNVIMDWELALGVNRRKNTEFEVTSCLTIVVQSEKAFFFNYRIHYCNFCSVLRRTASKVWTSKSAYRRASAPTEYTKHQAWVLTMNNLHLGDFDSSQRRISIFGFSPLCLVDSFLRDPRS